MKYWLISLALSGWAAGASVFINLLLAFQLPVAEYGVWVKVTALLPMVSTLMAPLVLMCSRVTSEHATQAHQAERILVLSATSAGILALGLVAAGAMFQVVHVAGLALWLVSVCKVALDGLVWSPNILRLGMADKIARSLPPTAVLVSLLVFQPTTTIFACLCMAGATGLCALVIMRWLASHLSQVSVSPVQVIRLYWKELPSAYLSLVSLGVFSVPLFIFSTKDDLGAAASLGISLTVVQGASAFATIILSQHLLSVARGLTPSEESCVIKIGTPAAIAFMSCVVATLLVGSYGLYRSIPGWPALAMATGCLVLVETSQGMITGILLRLGDRKVIASATASAILNISLGFTLVDPVELIWSIACVQLLSFLLPGIWRVNTLITARGSYLKVSI